MDKIKFSLSLILAFALLLIQVGGISAAPAFQGSDLLGGIVQSIILETDRATGITTVVVDLVDAQQGLQRVRVSQETAMTLGLVVLNGDGNPVINNLALGLQVEIGPQHVIPAGDENEHPVGSALATFFSDIAGLDYDTVMTAHERGIGFGVIAQALWLTRKLEGNAKVFEALLQAKQTGDYNSFILADGSTPSSWGQLRKAILDKDKKKSAGVHLSDADAAEQSNQQNNDQAGNQNGHRGNNHGNEKKDKNK
jgi:hypothetical protein